MNGLNSILKFYSKEEFDSFVKFFSFMGENAENAAQKLLLSSIERRGAFYAISNPCKIENSISKGTKIGGNYDGSDNEHTAKGLTQDKTYGFIQFDGVQVPTCKTEAEIHLFYSKIAAEKGWGLNYTKERFKIPVKPLRFYADIEASNGYFWKKGEHPKELKLGINNEGIYAKSITF